MAQHTLVEVKRGETPSFFYEVFQEEDTGPRLDLTSAVITVSSDIPAAPAPGWVVTDAVNGELTVTLPAAATLAMRTFERYTVRVEIITPDTAVHIIDLGIMANA